MNRGFSLWLDALRVLATVVVVLSHWAYPRFTGGDFIVIREFNLGSDAVIVFFVLSGFVIAFAAERDGKLPTYAFNRLTRLWSVMIPAIVLTFVFDRFGAAINPAAYPDRFYNPLPFWEILAKGLSFANEWSIPGRIRLGSNGPLWSLSYEAGFYILFGIAVFQSGVRRLALLVLMLLVIGPRVLLLMPAWLMGVWLWHWVKQGQANKMTKPRAIFAFCAGPVLYAISLLADVPGALDQLTFKTMISTGLLYQLGFSDEFLWNALVGVFTLLHLMGAAALLRKDYNEIAWIRWCAGASFSVYVTHYPALHLLNAILPADLALRQGALLFGSFAIGLVFAAIFERTLPKLRQLLRRLRQPSVAQG